MGSETQASAADRVPVIDLSNEELKAGTDAWVLACNQVKCALEEYGCFQAVYHRVPMELHNSLFSVLQDLFDLPIETKKQKTSETPYHSYIGDYSFLPLYESLGITDPTSQEEVQHFTNIMWPAGNHHFCENAHTFSKLLAELSQMVIRMVYDMYGVDERLYESHKASTKYLFRCMKYRTPQKDESNLGLVAHTDKSFISILHQDRVSGLQIKTKDGQWIDVEPSPSSFLVMASDALMAWSNDRLISCTHQVMMKENKTRYAVGFFIYKNGILQVPEELVDDRHPLRYKPFDHYDFLTFHDSQVSKRHEEPIKAYCGI